MARICEYQGKALLSEVGVMIPRGEVAETAKEAETVARRIGGPVVIKAQVLATGRFKAGGIQFAKTPEETRLKADQLLSMKIKNLPVKKVLVEEQIALTQEYYAGIVVSSATNIKAPVLIISKEGGTGVEEVAARNPERVGRLVIDMIKGLEVEKIRDLLVWMNVEKERLEGLTTAIFGLYRVFFSNDARSVEVNPFIWTKDGKVYAVDCHIALDDSSIFRHPEFGIEVPRDMEREPTELEKLAWAHIEETDFRGTGYFAQMVTEYKEGDVYIGFHGIGGGASMLGAAALINRGMKIANYADTSGDPPASKIYKVVKAIFAQPISAYVMTGACLANQEQWYHAFALVKALREELKDRPGFPVVILIAGNREKEAIGILQNGLRDLNIRLEIYDRDYIYRSTYIGERAQKLIDDYLQERKENAYPCRPTQ